MQTIAPALRPIAEELYRRRRALGRAILLAEELCKRCAAEADYCENLALLLWDAAEVSTEAERDLHPHTYPAQSRNT